MRTARLLIVVPVCMLGGWGWLLSRGFVGPVQGGGLVVDLSRGEVGPVQVVVEGRVRGVGGFFPV